MGIRQYLNEKKNVSTGLAVGFIVIAAAITVYVLKPDRGPNGDQAFYTDDDGATFFVDSTFLAPPFDHGGKEAVRANRYTYANGSKNFLVFLSKYPPEIKKQIDDAVAQAAKDGNPPSSIKGLLLNPGIGGSVLVKKPLSNTPWVANGSPEGLQIMKPVSPDNSTFDLMTP